MSIRKGKLRSPFPLPPPTPQGVWTKEHSCNAWHFEFGGEGEKSGIRITVVYGALTHPKQWLVRCHKINMEMAVDAVIAENDPEAAKEIALNIVQTWLKWAHVALVRARNPVARISINTKAHEYRAGEVLTYGEIMSKAYPGCLRTDYTVLVSLPGGGGRTVLPHQSIEAEDGMKIDASYTGNA